MAMDIDPFSMLEVSLQEEPESDEPRYGSAGVMHQVENDVQETQRPPPLNYVGTEVMNPQRAILNNIQKLASTTKEEEKFRRRAYSSISLVLRKRLHCTICDAHIGAYLGLKDMDIEHPLLKVLACSKCTLKYHYLEFPLSTDSRDVRCRWCTESSKEESPLRFCSYCPFAFCEMCIYRNLPLDELASNKSSWICFVCNVKDLWPPRAVLWALRVLIHTNLALKEEKKWSTDQSTCCKNKTINKPRRPITLPQSVLHPTNGHNVSAVPRPPVRAVMSMQSCFRNFNVRSPGQHQLYPRPIRPKTIPAQRPIANTANNQQLYDTSWLTEKVSNISTTLLNLNNNLHRLAQGIPERENKYSIKSKMISMVSLLNISATQLQKASKEMEEESKKILDKNYRVTRVQQAVTPNLAPQPSGSGIKRPLPSRNTTYKRKILRVETESSSEDDSDCTTSSTVETKVERMKTRACFVKLERLDHKIVEELESDDEVKSGQTSPQPSTSYAPGPLGAVGLCEASKQDIESSEAVSSEKKSQEQEPSATEENARSEAVKDEAEDSEVVSSELVTEENDDKDVLGVETEPCRAIAVEEGNKSEALSREADGRGETSCPDAPSPDEATSIAQPDEPASNECSNEAVPTDDTSEAEPRIDTPSQPSLDVTSLDVADSTNADNSASDHSTSESSITDTSTSDTG